MNHAQRVEPFNVPNLLGRVIRTEVYAERDHLSGGTCHPAFVCDGIAVKDEVAEPR